MSASKSRRARWIEAVLAVAVLAVIFAWAQGLLRRRVGPEDAVSPGGTPHEGRTATVESRQVPVTVEAVGSVRAVNQAAISSRVMGVVERITVEAGDRVRRGQILAALSAPELVARRAAAAEAVVGAEAALLQARSDYDRTDELFGKHAATKVEWELARTALAVAEANLARAKESAKGEEAFVSYTSLEAPFDGVVIERRMDPGDMAAPGAPLLILVEDRAFRLERSMKRREGACRPVRR